MNNALRSRSLRTFLSVLSAGLLLAGCAATPTGESTGLYGGQSPVAISDWQLTGRFSLTREEQGWHAGLFWQEQGDQYQLKISGPMGQGAFRLRGDADGVLLEQSDGQTLAAQDAEALLYQATGWHLPVSGLRYWIRGLPVPELRAQASRDAQGRLTRLEQSGWIIFYNRYVLVDGVYWPVKLRLVREDISVRLVIDQWQPGVATGFEP